MILYAHRGNLNGPIPERENHPDYIDEALAAGFHIEADLYAWNGEMFLGHDKPQYPVTPEWIEVRKDRLLLHLKSGTTTQLLFSEKYGWRPRGLDWHYFVHADEQSYAPTSKGRIWQTYGVPLCYSDTNSILGLITLELCDLHCVVDEFPTHLIYGICSDYVVRWRDTFPPKGPANAA